MNGHLRHYDVVERHRIVVAAAREDTYLAMRNTDFVRSLVSTARTVRELRDVPRPIREWVQRVEHLPPDTTFTVSDAVGAPFVLLDERRGRAVVIGAIGKLWRRHVAFLPLTPTEFRAFHEPKYAKLAIALWVEAVGRERCAVRFEARAAATDDSARAHLRRWYRVVRPFTTFVMRRALANIKAEAEAIATAPIA